MPAKLFVTCAMLMLSNALVESIGQAVPEDLTPQEAVARVRVIPFYQAWGMIDPAQVPVLQAVGRLSARERDRLLQSNDPHEIGVGIYVASLQGDTRCLLRLGHLFSNNEQTVPHIGAVTHVPPYVTEAQTVAQYLNRQYRFWFGMEGIDQKRFWEAMKGVENPDHLVNPWMVRFSRAADDKSQLARLRAEVGRLPERVRATVIIQVASRVSQAYSHDQVRTLIGRMSRRTKDALARGEVLVPNDPLYKLKDEGGKKYFAKVVARVMQAEPEAGK